MTDVTVTTTGERRLKTSLHLLPTTECATAAVMAGFGDLLAQMQSHKKEPKKLLVFDFARTFQFMIKGFGEGLLWTIWYRWADYSCVAVTQMLMGEMTSPLTRKCVGTLVAVVMDLCLACPFIYAFWDIPFPALLRGQPLRQIPKLIHDKLGEMLLASVKVWTPVNVVIYNVPVHYRSYFMSVADVFWQAIVSSITSAPVADTRRLEVQGRDAAVAQHS
jgi:Mpv17 / PMP22 family